MRSCENGHAIFPGEDFCDRCGAKAQPRFPGEQADQVRPAAEDSEPGGDQSAEVVPEYPGAPLTEYHTEYTSGSFTEYIAATEGQADNPAFPPSSLAPEAASGAYPDDAGPAPDVRPSIPGPPAGGFPAMLSALLAAPPESPPVSPDAQEGPAAPARSGAGLSGDDDGPSTMPGPTLPPDPAPGGGYRRPSRNRVLAAVVALVILGIAGVTGALIVMNGQSRPSAQPPVSSGTSSRPGSGSPSPAKSAAATEGVARWTTPAPVNPQILQGREKITGLACATQQVCYVADSGGGVLAERSAGNWPVAASDPNGGLVAISCASSRFCLALDNGGYSIALSQGTWGIPVLVGTGPGSLTSVSCTSPDFCMAVDTIGIGFQYGGPATGWTQLTVDPGGHRLNSVSCASPTNCVAVSSSGAVFTYNGTTWGADPVDRGHDLVSVSCPNVAFCMAVDSSGLAAEFAGNQWTLHPIEPGAAAVSCPSQGTCLASYDSGAVASYTSGHWSSPSVVDSGVSINQLSCVAVDSCVAADRHDHVLFYALPRSG